MGKYKVLGYWSGLVATLGGFLQSYAASVIAGALLFINREFHLAPRQDGMAAGIILLGALAGSISAGFLADRFGRRPTLMLAALLFIGSNVPVLFISSYESLLFIRFATGIAAGLTSLTVPLYLAEISPPKLRGAFVAAFQFAVTVGTLIAYYINLEFAEEGNWRLMILFTAPFALVQAVALFFIPETPKWLIGMGRTEKGAAVSKSLGADLIAEEKDLSHPKWRDLLSPLYRKGIWIGISLVVLQQWCGINAVVYFAPKIFQAAGFANAKRAIGVSMALGYVNCIATALSIFAIDKLGRRSLLLISQVGVGISLFLFTAAFFYPQYSYFSVIFLVVFLFTYALGLGPIPWVVISEIYPLLIRARAIAAMTFISWLSNFTVVFTFPRLLASWGSVWTFGLYTAIALVSVWWFKRIIPETKGKSLEEIEKSLY